jgi:hypothetical protein
MLARQIAVGFGIAIIFPLLVFYGVSTFHAAPKREAYFPFPTAISLPPSATPEERKERLDEQRKRQEAFDAAVKSFARVLVMVSTPLGIAAILIGSYLTFHAIGAGLIFGGIFTVAWGYWGYWQYLEDWMRFVSLLAGFAVLLFVGHRVFAASRTKLDTP